MPKPSGEAACFRQPVVDPTNQYRHSMIIRQNTATVKLSPLPHFASRRVGVRGASPFSATSADDPEGTAPYVDELGAPIARESLIRSVSRASRFHNTRFVCL